ncbi:DNA repair protein rhp54 [Elysia marginata]|uniref:DNA repair protein rhp54 n=1 Tax=Elysia marginata TaxID=1093978 RepID=A0AAV4GZ64_9GAST|nr:DNA repair protein rhp54 [Elysia marginata]
MYYSRQLNNYNLPVYGYHDKTGYNYLWNETKAKRGSNEIASCVITYLDNLNEKRSFKTVRLLSDSCGGQNRNRQFMAMLWLAAHHFDFEEICHGFFVRGHSQNESDSIHSRIEDASKHINIDTTSQWATVIGGAKKIKPCYIIKEMVQEEFLNFKRMRNQIPNMNKTVDRQKVKFTDIRMYAVHKGDPLVTIHNNLDQPAIQMNLFQTGKKILEMDVQMNLEPAYSRNLRIDTKKLSARKVVW